MSAPVQPAPPAEQKDASRGEVILYAGGSIEATIAGHIVGAMHQIMIVALLVNPLLLGLVMAIKTI